MAIVPTEVYETYWRFTAERHAIYNKRLLDPVGPWTTDPILQAYRFTNVFRAADRVSQYLIRNVQYRDDRSQSPDELFFRTLLFKIFNRIQTWEFLESSLGPLIWQNVDLNRIASLLDQAISTGHAIYSAAYIMPSPHLGHSRKHANHLAMLERMIKDALPSRLMKCESMQEAYKLLLAYPGMGPFLAFQYTIDLNYSNLLSFDEADFVVPGPGALDGISKCFATLGKLTPTDVIYQMTESQNKEFERLGLEFRGLFGRKLQPIDCQNVFCEVSKYSRAVHPSVRGIGGRTRIKQTFRPSGAETLKPMFPPKWRIGVSVTPAARLTQAQLWE